MHSAHQIPKRWQPYLLVLAPGGSLLQRGNIPDRQTPGKVDNSQQCAVRTQAHAEHTILDMTNSDAWFHNICICLSHQMRGWCVKAASHLFICVPGKQPEAGQPEVASFLTLPDRTDNGECLCVQDTVINKVQTTPHQTDIILVGSDLLVVWRARQHPPGCNPTAGGLGCAVIT